MNHLADSLPLNKSAFRSQAADMPAVPTGPTVQSSDVIDALWIAMADCYGHRWVSSYGADPRAGSGGTWARGLAGLSPVQVGQGIEACVKGIYPWPPTLGEFRALCLGVPPLSSVRADTTRQNGFTRLVWQFIDGHRYRHAPSDQADRLLREAYEVAREHVMNGGELPPEPEALIEQQEHEPKPRDPAVAADAIEKARRLLHGEEEL